MAHFAIPAAAETKVPVALQVAVYFRDRFACVYCGAAGVRLHGDHVRPQSHFAAKTAAATVNAPTNLVTACESCNLAKGSNNLAGFAAMLRGRGLSAKVVLAMVARVNNARRRAI